jgi:hypothetical protein
LTQGHANLPCTRCHTNGTFGNIPNQCIDCHQTNYAATSNPNHQVANIPTTCADCHTTVPGWKPATFAIHNTYYPLTGAHTSTSCNQCHNGNYTTTVNTCVGCHQANFTASTNPNHVAANIPNTCADCHTTNPGWKPATFAIHNTYYPLTGAHVTTTCNQCHNGNYTTTVNTCVGCHQANYTASTNPNHQAAGIPTTCADCHTTVPGWKPATFAIHNTYWPLTGAHITTTCNQCHNGNYTTTPNTCVGCHQNDYNQTNNPPHATSQFGTDCQTCHTTTAWSPATFNHDGTFFPIYSGKHQGTWTLCTECHTTPSNYAVFSCIDCHAHNNQTEVNNGHQGVSGYAYNSPACYSCHPTGSVGGSFNHDNFGFPLTGAHTTVSCTACHVTGYAGTPTVCSACHITAYNQTTNPNHVAANIPNTCATCHTTNPGWTPATFTIHNTYYPLTGAHITTTCNQCHNGNYSTTPNTCVGCHQANYTATTNPNHAAANIPTTCATCHTTNPGWAPATFAIHDTYYPLTGAHTTTTCNQCHNGNYSTTPNTCVGCHQANYTATTNPNHAAANIPTTCATCHTTNPGWAPATFAIHNTYYPLTGAHTTTTCNQCHNGNYSTTPNTCVGCHQANYTATTNPNHVAANIPTTCATCHTTNPGWTPATFAIHNTYYPLTGAHITVTCNQCHNGNYTTTPNTCYGCHQADYTATTNPPHASAQFPTNCESCHTTTAWIPSTFNHDGQYFPIYSGHHAGKWTLCADCHTNPSNYALFSCIDCHAHNNQTQVNNNHQGVTGYSYSSPACYNCHPTGGGGGKFMKVQPVPNKRPN